MPILNVTVANKIATTTDRTKIVCDNSDYYIQFAFDEEWDAYPQKRLLMTYNGRTEPHIFTGVTAQLPPIHNATFVEIGVSAGNLHTSTGALFECEPSVNGDNCFDSGINSDQYNEITEILSAIPAGGEEGQVLTKSEDGDYKTKWVDQQGGTSDHRQLTHRDVADQHPISAITNLQATLDEKANTGDIPAPYDDTALKSRVTAIEDVIPLDVSAQNPLLTESDLPAPYILPQANATTIGGIKADPKTSTDTQPVRIDTDGRLYTTPSGGSGAEEIFIATVGETTNAEIWAAAQEGKAIIAAENHYDETDSEILTAVENCYAVDISENRVVFSAWLDDGTQIIYTVENDTWTHVIIENNQKFTIEISPSDWNGTVTTKMVEGVTETNLVQVTPAPASISDWIDSGVYCSAQGDSALTFMCATAPTSTITANVVVWNNLPVQGEAEPSIENGETLKILMLTNSMGEDSFGYMPFIINNIHPEIKIDICLCKLSSASFVDHYDYIKNNREYTIYRYKTLSPVENSVFYRDTNMTLKTVLELNEWDMVLIHNSSPEQGNWDDYQNLIPSLGTPYFDYIVDYIRDNTTSGTKIGINMFATMGRNRVDLAVRGCIDATPGWINNGHFYENYTGGTYSDEITPENGKYYYARLTENPNIGVMYQYTNTEFVNVDGTDVVEQMKTDGRNNYYAMVVDCMKKLLKNTAIDYILPIGTAIQNARQLDFEWGDTENNDLMNGKDLTIDGVHLNEGLPVLIASYLSAEYFMNLKGISGGIFGDRLWESITQSWVDNHIFPGSSSEKHSDVMGISKNNVKLAQQCVAVALKSPFEYTDISDNPNINLPFDSVLDAPNDGKKYVRKNGEWVELNVSGKTIVEDYDTTNLTLVAQANTDYIYGTLANCNLSFGAGENGNEINIVFKSGVTATSLSITGNNQVHNAITVLPYQIYRFNAVYYGDTWIVTNIAINDELPAGFTPLKYVENGGEQFIKTDITNIDGLTVELQSQQTALNNAAGLHVLVGAKGASGGYADMIGYYIDPESVAHWVNHSNISGTIDVEYPDVSVDTEVHKFVASCSSTEQTLLIDNGSEIRSDTHGTVTATLPITLFCRAKEYDELTGAVTPDKFVVQKLFYAKFTNTGLNMYLKPALDLANRPCLVDINAVNKTVYYNQGTGEFGYEKLDGTKVEPQAEVIV